MTGTPRTPVAIALLGPTATGKTAAALALAERIPLEIVSIDSALVYRGMDIGTAKPGEAERARVPHHLVDINDPAEAYSAARFVADARTAITGILERGRLPLLVGGTMLYYRALVLGLSALPSADAAIRARLDEEARAIGWPALHARLAMLDPVTAARLAPNDRQRIQRALEIVELTGEPLPAREHAPAPWHDDPWTIRAVALEPAGAGLGRQRLAPRIDARFRAMLADGLLDEVNTLRARGDLHPALPSIRSVGYRQAWAYLDGDYGHGDAARSMLLDRATAATRQLAKRQSTWLRKLPVDARIDCFADDAAVQLMQYLARWMRAP